MENLIFSLNATMPIFILMALGYIFKRIGILEESFANKLNGFVFKISLPVLVFEDLAVVDIKEAWNGKFVLFCFVSTLLSIFIVGLLSLLIKDKSQKGEFIQGSYRSSAALLGIAFMENTYGNSAFGPLMIIGSVPLYNIFAVLVLSVFSPDNVGKKMDSALVKKTAKGVITNPIILGIIAGLIWSAFRIPMPTILHGVVSKVGATATPLGLMAMGASFEFRKAISSGKVALAAAFMKLIGLGALFVPAAIWLGYRQQELIAILVMLCSATTVSSFIMAKNMGHEGTVSSAIVALSTLLAAFTLTGWLYVLKTMGML